MAPFLLFCLIAITLVVGKQNDLVLQHHPLGSNNIKNYQYFNQTYSQSDAQRTLNFAYGAYCSAATLSMFILSNICISLIYGYQTVSWSCKYCENIPNFQIVNVTQNNYLQAFVGFDAQYNQSYAQISSKTLVITMHHYHIQLLLVFAAPTIFQIGSIIWTDSR